MSVKVLIIEDDDELRELIAGIFSKFKVQVYTARDGIVALFLIRQNKFNCILSDIDMPNMNGLELLKKINEMNLGIQTYMMTGSLEYDKSKVIELGAKDLFSKIELNATLVQKILNNIN